MRRRTTATWQRSFCTDRTAACRRAAGRWATSSRSPTTTRGKEAELARYCDLAEVDIDDVIAEMDSVPVVRDLVHRDALGEEIYPNCVQLLKTFRKTEEYPDLVLAKMRLGGDLMMDVGNIYTGALFAWLAAGIEEALEERVTARRARRSCSWVTAAATPPRRSRSSW